MTSKVFFEARVLEGFGTWAKEQIIRLEIAGTLVEIEYNNLAPVVRDFECIAGSREYLVDEIIRWWPA